MFDYAPYAALKLLDKFPGSLNLGSSRNILEDLVVIEAVNREEFVSYSILDGMNFFGEYRSLKQCLKRLSNLGVVNVKGKGVNAAISAGAKLDDYLNAVSWHAKPG